MEFSQPEEQRQKRPRGKTEAQYLWDNNKNKTLMSLES